MNKNLNAALNFRFGSAFAVAPVYADSGVIAVPAGTSVDVLTIQPRSGGEGIAVQELEVFDLQAGAGASALSWSVRSAGSPMDGGEALPSPADGQPLDYKGDWFSDPNQAWTLVATNSGAVDLNVAARVLDAAYYQLGAGDDSDKTSARKRLPSSTLEGLAPARPIVPRELPAESVSGTALPKSPQTHIGQAPTVAGQVENFFRGLGERIRAQGGKA